MLINTRQNVGRPNIRRINLPHCLHLSDGFLIRMSEQGGDTTHPVPISHFQTICKLKRSIHVRQKLGCACPLLGENPSGWNIVGAAVFVVGVDGASG